jgi:hypothetical protein
MLLSFLVELKFDFCCSFHSWSGSSGESHLSLGLPAMSRSGTPLRSSATGGDRESEMPTTVTVPAPGVARIPGAMLTAENPYQPAAPYPGAHRSHELQNTRPCPTYSRAPTNHQYQPMHTIPSQYPGPSYPPQQTTGYYSSFGSNQGHSLQYQASPDYAYPIGPPSSPIHQRTSHPFSIQLERSPPRGENDLQCPNSAFGSYSRTPSLSGSVTGVTTDGEGGNPK